MWNEGKQRLLLVEMWGWNEIIHIKPLAKCQLIAVLSEGSMLSQIGFDRITRKGIPWLKPSQVLKVAWVSRCRKTMRPWLTHPFSKPSGIIFWFHSLFIWRSGVNDLIWCLSWCALTAVGFDCRDHSVTWTPGRISEYVANKAVLGLQASWASPSV